MSSTSIVQDSKALKLLLPAYYFVTWRKISIVAQLPAIRYLMCKCWQWRAKDSMNIDPHLGYLDELYSMSLQVLQFSKLCEEAFITWKSRGHSHQLWRRSGGSSPPNHTQIGKDPLKHSNAQKEPGSQAKGCLRFQKNLLEATTHLGRNGDRVSALDFRHTLWQPAADMPGTSFRKSHFLQRRPLCSVVVAFVSSFSWLLCLEVV